MVSIKQATRIWGISSKLEDNSFFAKNPDWDSWFPAQIDQDWLVWNGKKNVPDSKISCRVQDKDPEKAIEDKIAKMNKLGLQLDGVAVVPKGEIERLVKEKGIGSFVDTSFPPNVETVVKGKKQAKGERARARENFAGKVQWRRAGDVLGKDFKLFDGISPDDLEQGKLGDCWFICTVSNLSERPAAIEHVFKNCENKTSEAGVYVLRMCIDGMWRDIVVDDYVPCKPYGGPIFAGNNGSELWAMLIEKAYAKVYGGYQSIVSGRSSHAMMDLTGNPSFTMSIESKNDDVKSGKAWKMLKKYAALDTPIALGTYSAAHYKEMGYTVAKLKSEVSTSRLHLLWP